MVSLGTLAKIRRGITSGANDVFYLPRARALALGLESELLWPLLRSPRDGGAAPIEIDPNATPQVALICPADGAALARHPNAAAWIAAHADHAQQSTLRGRSPWWVLPARPAQLFFTKAYGARFAQRVSRLPLVADQRVYAVEPRPHIDHGLLTAMLNSTFTAFAIESLGRASLGHGALEWTVADAGELPILDPRRLSAAAASALRAAFAALAPLPVRDIGQERARVDRAALDCACASVASETAQLLPAVWDALTTSVERRTRRARHVHHC
jgi:hypothetical protein